MKASYRSSISISAFRTQTWCRRHYGTVSHLMDLKDHFQTLESTLGIRRLDDWYSIKWQDVRKASDSPLLRVHFNHSLYHALKEAYPEHNWIPWKFSSLPTTFWTEETNQRAYLDWLKDQLGLKSLEDWYHVRKKDIIASGGARFGELFESGGLFKLLQKYYPTHPWHPWKLDKCPQKYWQDIDNQRAYMEWLLKKMEFTSLDDWYKITKADFVSNYGTTILKQYKDSIYNLLCAVYNEHKWVPWKMRGVPRGFWSDMSSQRLFFDSLAQELNIKTYEDWYKVSTQQVLKMRGVGLLGNYYNHSLFLALRKIYPEYDWKPWKFHRMPYKAFADMSYVRAFLEEASEKLFITQLSDWYRVSSEQVFALGGRPLLEYYGNLLNVLELNYPEFNWEVHKFIGHPGRKKSGQRWLRVCVQELFPREEVVEEFVDQSLTFPVSKRPMELDIYVPKLRLAFEFQGQQHYHDTFVFGALERYKARDLEKQRACKDTQITLIEIPYFWDRSKEALKNMILKKRPEMFQ